VSDDIIRFNGVGDDGHETFCLTKEASGFEFCKTAGKPYDILACAILAAAKQHAGDGLNVSSDGDANDWVEGLSFASKVLKRAVPYPVSQKPSDEF
jgi:hypothetical protein